MRTPRRPIFQTRQYEAIAETIGASFGRRKAGGLAMERERSALVGDLIKAFQKDNANFNPEQFKLTLYGAELREIEGRE